MIANNSALLVLLALLITLLIFNSPPPTFAAKDDPIVGNAAANRNDSQPYKAVNEFCNQRNSKKDREFCTRALKSDPRSAAAEDIVGLLKISVDLAVRNANRTQQFLKALSQNKTPNAPLMAVLKDCSAAYNWCLKELQIIPRELLDDAALASYDALMASDALMNCKDSLEKNKIPNHSILSRHKISTAYVRLCVDIARSLF